MSDDQDTEQLNIKVPSRTKELAKERLEHGGLTRVVRERLQEIAHGGETTQEQRVKDHLAELRDERKQLKQERMEIGERIDVVERKIERAEQELGEIRDQQSEYEGALQLIEENMREDNMRIFEGHGQVKQAAEIGNCAEKDVIADIRERNSDIPDEQFERGI